MVAVEIQRQPSGPVQLSIPGAVMQVRYTRYELRPTRKDDQSEGDVMALML